MRSPPLHHPVPQHRVQLDAVQDPYNYAYQPQPAQPAQQPQPDAFIPTAGVAQQSIPSSSETFNPLQFVPNSEIGVQAFSYGQAYISRNFSAYVPSTSSFKYYFQVSNSYVRRKLLLILFPWRHSPWSRSIQPMQGESGLDVYAFPAEDVNAPDMYIPLMAFVTHLVSIALVQGVKGSFHPEQFGARASQAIFVMVAELVLLKISSYILDIMNSSLADLSAYSGYKFVGITLTTLAGLVSTRKAVHWGVFGYTACATAFFMLRSLKYILLPEYSAQNPATTISGSARQKRIQFLFFYGFICQIFLMFVLL